MANAVLLEGLQHQLTRPETVSYVSGLLTERLASLVDDRPARRAALELQCAEKRRAVENLVRALEYGESPGPVLERIRTLQQELVASERALAELGEPAAEKLVVFPSWVEQQLSDLAGLLSDDTILLRQHFRRLGLNFTFNAVTDNGRPFLQAFVNADVASIGLGQYFPSAASGALHPRSGQ